MAEDTTYYRPGLRFKVKPGPAGGGIAHQEICFPGKPAVYNADGTLQQEEIRQLVAEFGLLGPEYTPTGADGEPLNDLFDGHTLRFADIRGGFFDLDNQAEEKGWTEREREIVARHMLRKLNDADCLFLPATAPRPAAPWPTYDTMHAAKIAPFAVEAGAVDHALRYEVANKNRESVVNALRAAAAKASAEAAVPAEDDELAVA